MATWTSARARSLRNELLQGFNFFLRILVLWWRRQAELVPRRQHPCLPLTGVWLDLGRGAKGEHRKPKTDCENQNVAELPCFLLIHLSLYLPRSFLAISASARPSLK